MYHKENYKIQDFVQDLLKNRFPRQAAKQQVNDEDPTKLNFACPYCGDSEKDLTKKRGNLYLNTNSYKCFNDGCLTWVPLHKFVSKYSLEYSLYVPNIDMTSKIPSINLGNNRGSIIEAIINPKVRNSLLDFSYISDRFSLIPCKDADPKSKVGEYVRSRNLTGLPAFDKSCFYDSRENKIYIFNLDLISGKVLGLAIRKIDDSMYGPKYNIKNYTDLKKNNIVSDIEEDILNKINAINNYFNILNINFNSPVIVTEGQIDSMFLDNSIATTGVSKSKTLLESILSKKNARILFDNDKAGKEESLKFIKQGYRVFMWSKIISDLKVKYPNLIKDINQIKDVNDLYSFTKKINPDIGFLEFNNSISDNFTESMYDLLHI